MRRQLATKQAGFDPAVTDINLSEERLPNETDEEYIARQQQRVAISPKNAAERALRRDMFREASNEAFFDLVNTSGADIAKTGYGDANRDTKVPFEEWAENPVDYRAKAQSGLQKIGNGIAKMGVTGVSTFADNFGGLITGLGNIAVDAANGGEFHPVDSFVNNPFSNWMQAFRDWSEKFFPNYRSTEEIADQDEWWKHLNANFFGDVLIKNLGFTLGAAGSGAVASRALQAFRGPAIREAYKAGMAAAINGDAAAESAFQSVLQGAGIKDAKGIYKTFKDASNHYQKLGTVSNIVGSSMAALGEARVEAMSAAKEFRDAQVLKAQQRFQEGLDAAEEEAWNNLDNIYDEGVYDGFGNKVGSKPALNQNGLAYMDAERKRLAEEYQSAVNAIDKEAMNLSNATFGLNSLVLSLSNMVMFGKLFSGGYKDHTKARVRGKFGNYKQGSSMAEAILTGFKNAGTEGLEELTQKIISEGEKDIAENNMAAFYNHKYDKDAVRTMGDWGVTMLNSAGETIKDPKSWEEFTVGFLTGMLGMPNFKHISQWSGGMVGGIYEGLNKRDLSRGYAEELNKLVKSEDFRDRWLGLVRHVAYERRKEKDLENKDRFAWHGDNDAQLMSDIMLFANAGRLQDLNEFVDSLAEISPEEVENVRSIITDEFNPKFDIDKQNMSTEELGAWLKERARQVKDRIEQYKDIRSSIDYMSLGTADKDVLDELVFTEAQLSSFENRYNDVLHKVIAKLTPSLTEAARKTKGDGSPTEQAEFAQSLLEKEENLRSLFSGENLYRSEAAKRSGNNEEAAMFAVVDDAKQQIAMNTLEELGAFAKDPTLKEEISDLQKLIRSRQQFYSKLLNPKFREKFEEDKKKEEDVVEEIEEEEGKDLATKQIERLKNVKSMSDYLKALDDFFNEISGKEFPTGTFDSVDKFVEGNAKLKEYDNASQAAEDFKRKLKEAFASRRDALSGDPVKTLALSNVEEALGNVDEREVLTSMREGSDPEIEIAKRLLEGIDGNKDAEKLVRNVLESIMADKAQASGLGTIEDDDEGEDEGGGEEGGGSGGGSGGISMAAHLEELIKKIQDENDTTLGAISSGDFSAYPGISREDMSRLQELAMVQLAALRAKRKSSASNAGLDAGRKSMESTSESDADKERRHKEFVALDTSSIRNGAISVYNYKAAEQGVFRKDNSGELRTRAKRSWYIKHCMQQFIDTGALAELSAAYEKKNPGKRLPIYFLANPVLHENNIENNPFTTASNIDIVLAVEADDFFKETLSKYLNAENPKFGTEDSFITVGEGESAVKYQVIGEVFNPTPDFIEKSEAKGDKGYDVVKQQAQKMIYNYAVTASIKPQYKVELDKAGVNAFPAEGKWYVAKVHPSVDAAGTDEKAPDLSTGERLYTTLNYIASGRNETRANEGDEYKKIPLSETLKEYAEYGKPYHFALILPDETITTDGAPDIVTSGIDAPAGSLWMATQEANGAWAWTHVFIAQADEYNFEGNKDTVIMQAFDGIVNTILKESVPEKGGYESAEVFSNRLGACKALSDMFYFGKGNAVRVYVPEGGGKPSVYIGGAECRSKQEVISALKDQKVRFQVDIAAVRDREDLEVLIDSNVLMSEMRSFIRKGANLGVNFLEDTAADGQKVSPYPRDSKLPIARTAGSERVYARRTSKSNIIIGKTGYKINEDGTVSKMGPRGTALEVVEQKETVAQVKALAELMDALKDENLLNEYAGKRWIVDRDGLQYTELFEREIDGIKVRMQRRGKNIAVKPLTSSVEWDALMEVAQPVASTYSEPPSPKEPESPTPADLAAYDAAMAAEAGGTVAKKGKGKGKSTKAEAPEKPAKRRRPKDVTEAIMMFGGDDSLSKTSKEITEDREKKTDTCEWDF